jgi:hypothetical protein
LKDFRIISLDNKTQNDINKKLHPDKIENYEFSFPNIEEIKKSRDSISIDDGSQTDTLSQTSDSSNPLSNKKRINKGFLFEKIYISFYLGYEEYYRQLMPEKFFEYKKSKNYLSKNSCLKKIEQNNYLNYTNEYINYFHYSDYAHFNTKTCENGFPFYITYNNYNKEENNKIVKEEIIEVKELKELKEKETEDNKDNNKQNQQINNRNEEKDKNNYLNNKNNYINRKNQYQKYNNNKGHKFKYYKRERHYVNRKCNKFSKFNFCDNFREEKYKCYNSYYY